ncbi:MAG: excinuclease ABC subunit UvrB [Pseudomonadales bacterium]|nr:excinuclease ABC subunit UvrB [Pseudomonadales bacterium]
MQFKLHSSYQPTGDQPRAISQLVEGITNNQEHQVLLGVTGSGKTFTMANVIEQVQKPTLVIAHNKTLAAQLYQEFRDFFPENAVSYFVSYYDYYQPEAYIPTTDTYIEKEATINDEIDKLRLAATTNLLTRKDVIVIASVSCIYNLGSPVEYGKYLLQLVEGEVIQRESILLQLANLQYDRSDTDLRRGSYRVRGDSIQVWPAYEDKAIHIDTLSNTIQSITWIDPISGTAVTPSNTESENARHKRTIIYPAKHYMMDPKSQTESFKAIEADLQKRVAALEQENKVIEAYRLKQKVSYDLEMMREFGFVNGIENYSRYFDGRKPNDPPFTLLDYFTENVKTFDADSYLTIIDESHMTLPQIRGMYNGDQARKKTLIEYGFRLPSALDNRPLQFHEFLEKSDQFTHVSATPEELEISYAGGKVVEQLIRPTGLVDPTIELRPIDGQIEDLVAEIVQRKQRGERVLVTTLTKKMAEALTEYLNNHEKIDMLLAKREERKEEVDEETTLWNQESLPVEQMEIGPIEQKYYHHLSFQPSLLIKEGHLSLRSGEGGVFEYPKVAYLHSDIQTLERSDILDDLRRGEYDVVVGINLLREGLDLPEVTLVAILDADKEGFLRSRTSLIQTMGRAARHADGHAILYADRLTGSMERAIEETQRRRQAQIAYNLEHSITPQTISKPIRERMVEKKESDAEQHTTTESVGMVVQLNKTERIDLSQIDPNALTAYDKKKLAAKLKRRMAAAVKEMDFELAAVIRDVVRELE